MTIFHYISVNDFDLPVARVNFQMVSSPDKKVLYAIGGHVGSVGLGAGYYTNDIFKFHCTGDINTCRWTKSETTLRFERHNFVAIPIPNSLAVKLCQIDPTTAEPINTTIDPTTVEPIKTTTFYSTYTYPTYPTNYYGPHSPDGPWQCDYYKNYVGDGFCDDETNLAECNHDGGDCCGDDVNKNHCNKCICHSNNLK